jgi:hypothetical protein
MSVGVPREIVIEKNKHRFLNLLAKINRSTEKYNSLLKRALTITIGLLYLQLTDHVNVPWAVDITIFMQGFPETWKLFQGFLQGKKIEKGWFRRYRSTEKVSRLPSLDSGATFFLGKVTMNVIWLFVFMSKGWDDVSELRPSTDLLFIPRVICAWRATAGWCRQGKTPHLSTRSLRKFYQQSHLVARQVEYGKWNAEIVLRSISFILRDLFNMK